MPNSPTDEYSSSQLRRWSIKYVDERRGIMSLLTKLPELVGFFSYSRKDDKAFKGKLSELRDAISSELSAQLGRKDSDFIFQDQKSIGLGKLWEAEIAKATRKSAFFIPIVTPRSVGSSHCRFEFDSFLARQATLGRKDLIFPILYLAVPELEDEAQWRNDPVLSVIGLRQYIDWQEIRHFAVNSPEVGKKIEHLCIKICIALRQQWPEESRADKETAVRHDVHERPRQDAAASLKAEAHAEANTEARRKPKSASFVSIGTLFKGRDDVLMGLQKSLFEGDRTKPHVISGLGGVGKTRMALEYGLAHEKEYSALLFVSGETAEALDRSIADLASVLLIDTKGLEEDQRLNAVLDWLGSDHRWFLLIDNLDTPQALKATQKHLARLSDGHTVITTRLANFSGQFTKLELDVLTLEASVNFLMDRTDARLNPDDGSDRKHALEIAKDLGQLALALEQAGAYICRLGLTFAEYQRAWKKQREKLLGWNDDTVTGYPRSVAVTWFTSFEQLSPDAQALLEHLAFLAPEPTPKTLLCTPLPGHEATNLEEALAVLAEFSLVSRDPKSFSLHRLVQDVMRRSLTPENAAERVYTDVRWLDMAANSQDVSSSQRALLALHIDALAAFAAPNNLKNIDLQRCLASAYSALGDLCDEEFGYRLVSGVIEKSFRIRERLLEANPENPSVMNDLASSYASLGFLAGDEEDIQSSEAVANFEKCLVIQKELGQKYPDNANIQGDLARAYFNLDLSGGSIDGDAAREAAKKAHAFALKLEQDDPRDPALQHRLANSFDLMGDLAESATSALDFFAKAIAIQIKLAKEDPADAAARSALIFILYKMMRDSDTNDLAEANDDPDHPYRQALLTIEGLPEGRNLALNDEQLLAELKNGLCGKFVRAFPNDSGD
jgi:hypothetical protein